MMQLIVYVTFSILPIVTLLYFQIKFLPYHDVSITYWHRIAVILGFAMLILLTPLMQNKRAAPRRWDIKIRAASGSLGGVGHAGDPGADPSAARRSASAG